MTSEPKTIVGELISDLKQQRDHLRLKIKLGGEDLRDEFEKLDDKLAQLNHRFDPIKNAVGETSEDVWDSLKLLGGEIKDGFRRIRKSLFT